MSDNVAVHREAFWLLAGKKLGAGIARAVYVSRLSSDQVIKVEDESGSFQNVIEWETWQRVKDTPFAKWFAPCIEISPCGLVLVQARTKVPQVYPDRMPAFFTDFKYTNYGLYKGQIVAHDYGMHLLMERGMTKAMRKANWWSQGES